MSTSTQDITASAAATIEVVEDTFESFDGTTLFYRAWMPVDGQGRASAVSRAVLLFHRGHEHSGRYDELARGLADERTAVFAWDARGHGRSPGERGWAPGFSTLVKDADAFARHVGAKHAIPMEEMAIVAHSVGAVVAAAWVHDYAPPVRAMVLASPALRVKLYVPLAMPALRMLNRVKSKSFIKSYVRAGMLTHDEAQAQAYRDDPLISRQIAVNILIDLHDASTRLLKDAGAIATPALVLGAGSDWVVKNSAMRRFFEGLSSPVKEMAIFEGMGHSIFHEIDRGRVIARTRRFIEEQFARGPERSIEPVQAYTRRSYERLSRPAPWYCAKGWLFAAQRWSMKTVCRLSGGIRLGWRTGFDSGQSLNYVYRNRAGGITPLGWLIDRFYLSSIGWRGIRRRREHLVDALERAARSLASQWREVAIVDIASGPGAYVLEALGRMRDVPVRAVLRDRSFGSLEEGRQMAKQMGIENATYDVGDAFSYDELARLEPRPDVAIVSGLYELFEDNQRVMESLRGLAAAMREGSLLIYTNQPWHPQLEFIARVLDNREGRPWVMRCRTQREIDGLVRDAGFEKIAMEIDQWGIFTVSVARRMRG